MSHYLNNSEENADFEDLHLVNPSQDIKQQWQRDSLKLRIDAHIDGQLSAFEWKEIETQVMSDKVLFEYFQERTNRFKHISNLISSFRIDNKQKEKLTEECVSICRQFVTQSKFAAKDNWMSKISKVFNLN
jgi:hypothetical protein